MTYDKIELHKKEDGWYAIAYGVKDIFTMQPTDSPEEALEIVRSRK